MFSPSRAPNWCNREREATDKHNTTQQVTQMHYCRDNLEQNVIILYILLLCVLFQNENALLVFLGYDVGVNLCFYWNKEFTVLKRQISQAEPDGK